MYWLVWAALFLLIVAFMTEMYWLVWEALFLLTYVSFMILMTYVAFMILMSYVAAFMILKTYVMVTFMCFWGA